MKVVTRFAPSPTGYLHVGGFRTALYNYFYARQQGGEFILRIEDTDRSRYVEGSIESLINVLKTMGLDIDRTPYIQSDRLEIYQKHIQKLIEQGSAYYCFCTKERLESVRNSQIESKQQTKYDRTCSHLSKEDVEKKMENNEPCVVRLHIPEGKTVFMDEIRGEITIDNSEIDDQVLLKTDGFPTYHLAVVVDDNDMGVTHVIRAEEWISSVPKHIILYKAFGFDIPKFAHLPLVLNPDKSKLSKRQGDVAVEDYLKKGYLPEALLNFIALLGFNPTADREIYTKEELIRLFDLSKINKSGAVFDLQKLNWMNEQYLKKKTIDELCNLAKPFMDEAGLKIDPNLFKKICKIEQERITTLQDIPKRVFEYEHLPEYNVSILTWKKSDSKDALVHLNSIKSLLNSLNMNVWSDISFIESAIKGYIEIGTYQNGNVLWPLRVSLSGMEKSPSPFEYLWILGKEESLRRIDHAIKLLT